ncbi:MAG: hypothetical protein JWR85_4040 [Marmoricola sp.]|nr:hypothetical protein [Marmoricola sp.]
MRYAVIRTNGTHELIEADGRLRIEEMQQLVAAPNEDHPFVEAVNGPNLTVFINENGKYLPLATNQAVTQYAHDHQMIWPHDDIRGDCVITGIPDDEGYEQDVEDEVLKDILSYL